MSTSVTDGQRGAAARTAFMYLMVSIFCALFGAVYEVFSHGVFSFYMIYAFALPLVGGVLPYMVMSLGRIRYPRGLSRWLGHAGIEMDCTLCNPRKNVVFSRNL